ncbi:hypothetical protein L1987_39859 [Smallanthus sonchifolius]|uniref:Uncharacterized protein n=1 Tax=Smallanthus sonchifolius TaxID=185202 RepID=A0ACB9GSY4_9ASTR|nr:hypothetical protein L1987_39859 [Smallanthus sonchifolius]
MNSERENGQMDLRLGLYLGKPDHSQSKHGVVRMYTCRFCKRKFHNSQALGGHQNAHRRERNAVKHYHSHLLHRTENGEASIQSSRAEKELVAFNWCVSSYSNPPQLIAASEQHDQDSLDLNLKL